jgi:hypothetical protein
VSERMAQREWQKVRLLLYQHLKDDAGGAP